MQDHRKNASICLMHTVEEGVLNCSALMNNLEDIF